MQCSPRAQREITTTGSGKTLHFLNRLESFRETPAICILHVAKGHPTQTDVITEITESKPNT
jgi:hypothetical protein